MKYPKSKRFVVLAQGNPGEPFYDAGSFDTEAEANQFIGKQHLDEVNGYVIDKENYPEVNK